MPIICSKTHQGLVMLENKGSIRTWIEEDKCIEPLRPLKIVVRKIYLIKQTMIGVRSPLQCLEN